MQQPIRFHNFTINHSLNHLAYPVGLHLRHMIIYVSNLHCRCLSLTEPRYVRITFEPWDICRQWPCILLQHCWCSHRTFILFMLPILGPISSMKCRVQNNSRHFNHHPTHKTFHEGRLIVQSPTVNNRKSVFYCNLASQTHTPIDRLTQLSACG